MLRLRKLVILLTVAPLLAGALAVSAPVYADRPGDPNCKRACPPTKKLNGFTCVFAGCDGEGNCLYAC
jgi:hypothetical protein